jgi:hypothetical protein
MARYRKRMREQQEISRRQREERLALLAAEREAADRKRRAEGRATLARERAEMDAARAWWSERNPYYADKPYIPTYINQSCVVDGDAELPADHWIWLPQPIAARLGV